MSIICLQICMFINYFKIKKFKPYLFLFFWVYDFDYRHCSSNESYYAQHSYDYQSRNVLFVSPRIITVLHIQEPGK